MVVAADGEERCEKGHGKLIWELSFTTNMKGLFVSCASGVEAQGPTDMQERVW